MKLVQLFGLLLLCLTLHTTLAHASATQETAQTAQLYLNGVHQGSVDYIENQQGLLLDVDALALEVPQAQAYDMFSGTGFVLQYGKTFSFAALGRDWGFIAAQKTALSQQLISNQGKMMAPVEFVAGALGASYSFDADGGVLNWQMPNQAQQIGDIIPQAANLAARLESVYSVRQGSINLSNAIDLFAAGYTSDCNGNNGGFAYFVTQTPPSPRNETYNEIPLVYQSDPDEAFVMIGQTPPKVDYFSYRSYLVDRYYQDTQTHQKIYASLGDTVNNYDMIQNLGSDNVYDRPFMVISTADKRTYESILKQALAMGFLPKDIYLDIVPADMMDLGLDVKNDTLSFLHRASVFNDPDQKADYLANPTIEVLRLTPKASRNSIPLYQQPLRNRETGISETDVDPSLPGVMEDLYTAILERHGSAGQAQRLDTYVWLEEGNQAIADRTNVLGETRDTLYTRTDSFSFDEDDLIVVFGVNHSKTAKSVYSNMSCYGAEYFNGFGGITNYVYQGSAWEYLPDVDPQLADKFYVWKFARSQLDDTTFVVPQNTNGDYEGINYGDQAFMAFRSYVDLKTLVGVPIDEIVRDQAVVFKK